MAECSTSRCNTHSPLSVQCSSSKNTAKSTVQPQKHCHNLVVEACTPLLLLLHVHVSAGLQVLGQKVGQACQQGPVLWQQCFLCVQLLS